MMKRVEKVKNQPTARGWGFNIKYIANAFIFIMKIGAENEN